MGGVETYTLHLAQAVQELGHEVHILTGEPVSRPDLAVEIKADAYAGIPVTRLIYDYLRRPVYQRASYSDPLVTAQLKAILQKLQPDVVHATSLSLVMAGLIEATTTLNLPLIYTATDFVLTCRRGTYLKRNETICSERENLALCTACMGPQTTLEKFLAGIWRFTPAAISQPLLISAEKIIGKRADFVQAAGSMQYRLDYLSQWRSKIEHIIAPSTYMRDMLIHNDFPPARITVSPYGVRLPSVHFAQIPSPKLRFAFIGRVAALKGVHLLIEAFRQLPPSERVELTLYGQAEVKSDQYLRQLQQKVAHIPNVKFAGVVDNTHISEIYRNLDVLIVPSIWPENSPITILEALAHGIPVIASDVAGIADLVQHEVNGLIFANQNIEDLVRQMSRCLESPELVAQLAGNCKLVKSLREDARDLTNLYARVI